MLPPVFTKYYFQQLETATVRSRRTFLGLRQGGHISPRKGHGIEFSDYRQYELGDNPRYIDWNVYARSDRFVIKRFQEEESLSVLVLLDQSKSMGFDSKWERVREIGLSVSYVALKQNDVVFINALGEPLTHKGYGRKQFFTLAERIAPNLTSTSRTESSFSFDVSRVMQSVRFPGICFVIGDFLEDFSEIQRGLLSIRKKNFLIHVIQVLGDTDYSPSEIGNSGIYLDSETQEEVPFHWTQEDDLKYKNNLAEHILQLERYCQGAGISYSRQRSSEPLEDFVLHDVLRKGLLR